MKTIILMTLFLGLLSMSCLSQEKNDLIIDSPFLALTMNPYKNNVKTLDFKINRLIKKPIEFDKYIKIPELKTKIKYDSNNYLALIENQSSFYKMPCYKPEIRSTMPIVEPDSTTRHTLLIKKIN